MDVYSSADPAQPAGQLLAYARSPLNDTQIDVLYEVSLPLLENDARLSFTEPSAQWQHRALPYLLNGRKISTLRSTAILPASCRISV